MSLIRSTKDTRKASLDVERFRTMRMNQTVKDIILAALRDVKRNAPNTDDYDRFYSGIMSPQALKNFARGGFYLTREVAEVMLESASYHYLDSWDDNVARVQELLNRVETSQCDPGRMMKISAAWRSTYSSVGLSPRLLVGSRPPKTLNSSEF